MQESYEFNQRPTMHGDASLVIMVSWLLCTPFGLNTTFDDILRVKSTPTYLRRTVR